MRAYTQNRPSDTIFMAAMAMVLPKKYETLTLTLKICILQENGFKELTLVLFESLF